MTTKWAVHAGTKISEFPQSLEEVPSYLDEPDHETSSTWRPGVEAREVECPTCGVVRDRIWMVTNKECRVCSMERTYNRNIAKGLALGIIIEE